MQDNTITLSVDSANDGNPANQAFVRSRYNLTKSLYTGSGNTVDSRNQLTFTASDPKRSGESRGIAKSALKFTLDVAVLNSSGSGNITLPCIAEVSFAVPVGTTPAQTMEMRQRLVALLDDDAVMAKLMDNLEV